MKIRQAKAADLPRITDVYATAFLDEKLTSWLFPFRLEYFQDYRRELEREIQSKFYTPGYAVWVAEIEYHDENHAPAAEGEIVGFAIWERHGTSAAALIWQTDTFSKSSSSSLLYAIRRMRADLWIEFARLLQYLSMTYKDLTSPDRSSDRDHIKLFEEKATDSFAEIAERWHLCNIATLPSCRRRGIATLLTQWGLDAAAREEVPATLEATIDAEPLYRRLGFRDYSYIVVVEGINGPALIWEPRGLEGFFGNKMPQGGPVQSVDSI